MDNKKSRLNLKSNGINLKQNLIHLKKIESATLLQLQTHMDKNGLMNARKKNICQIHLLCVDP